MIVKQQRVYNEEERGAIDVFKEKYMDATTSAGRKTVAQQDIFPALFNHWKSKGRRYNEEEIRVKSNVCSYFLKFVSYVTVLLGSFKMVKKFVAKTKETGITRG